MCLMDGDRRRRLRWRLRRGVLIEGLGGIAFVGFAIAFLAGGSLAAGFVFLGIALVPLGMAVAGLLGLRRLRRESGSGESSSA